jgi:methyl-accepting chemotaxis protein
LTADGSLLAATNASQIWQSRLTGQLLADVTGVNGRESEVQFSATSTDSVTGELAMLVAATADDLLAVGVFYPATLARRALTNVFSAGDRAVAFVVIEEPWRAVADPLLRTTEFAPLVLAPALIITLVAIWFGMRQIVQPLQSLEQKTMELAWGDFEAIEEPVGGIGEIRRLQAELVHMADKVKTAQ